MAALAWIFGTQPAVSTLTLAPQHSQSSLNQEAYSSAPPLPHHQLPGAAQQACHQPPSTSALHTASVRQSHSNSLSQSSPVVCIGSQPSSTAKAQAMQNGDSIQKRRVGRDYPGLIEYATAKLGADLCSPGEIARLRLMRGCAYLKTGQPSLALSDFNSVLELNAHDTAALYYRGALHEKDGQLDLAIQDYTSVLQLDPDNVKASYARAACRNRKGELALAIDDYQHALDRDAPSSTKSCSTSRLKAAQARASQRSSSFSQTWSCGPGDTPQSAASDSLTSTTRFCLPHLDSAESRLLLPPAVSPGLHFGTQPAVSTLTLAPQHSQSSLNQEACSSAPPLPHHQLPGAAQQACHQPPSTSASHTASVCQSHSSSLSQSSSEDSSSQQEVEAGPPRRGQAAAAAAARGTAQLDHIQIRQRDEAYQRGLALRKAGKYDSAIAEYSQALSLDPTHFKSLFNRGYSWDKVGCLDKALADYGEALQLEPRNSFAWYNSGIIRDRVEDFAGAIQDFSRAIELDGTSADFFHNRGFSHRKQASGDSSGVIAHALAAEMLYCETSATGKKLCQASCSKQRVPCLLLLLLQGNLEAAIADYTSAIELAPRHCRAYFNRAFCHDKLNHVEAAVRDYSRALELEPNNAHNTQALQNRAALYERLGMRDEALSDLTAAVDAGPQCAQSWHARALLYQGAGRLQAALADLDAAVDLEPECALFLRSRGGCRRMLDDLAGAAEDFTRALALEPGNAQCHMQRGHTLRRLGAHESAVLDYTAALEAMPHNVKLLNNRAYCFAKLHLFAEAVADYDAVLKLDPTNAHALHNVSVTMGKMDA
ncbi:hypothetical protein QJQ45_024116 [Haematococcus lacustris]|nr:hypothetical protein QJQ45_024116 [Haematococcus lacustris]